MRGHRLATWKGRALGAAILAFTLSASTAWGYFFDERREMSLSGPAYSWPTFALSDVSDDSIGAGRGIQLKTRRGHVLGHVQDELRTSPQEVVTKSPANCSETGSKLVRDLF
jgi:hypothetical protein